MHYLHQWFPREEMAALYLAADIMLVTSLRDGMNLVAKEYVGAGTTSAARWSCRSSRARQTNSAKGVSHQPLGHRWDEASDS